MSIPATMRTIHTTASGGADMLRMATGEVPRPGASDVLIRVLAAGVNRVDIQQRQGMYPPPAAASDVLGVEIAGEIAAIGPDAGSWRLGDRVCALVTGGGYAEYCIAPAALCLPWPENYDAVAAAALPQACFTVWQNLFDIGWLLPGESLLVHGGTSGIGVTAIQFAREFGAAAIYATAGSAEKCAACVRFGADAGINYREEDFVTRIRDLTGGRGVNLVLDIVGGPAVARNLRCLDSGGRLVMIAFLEGSKASDFDFARVMLRQLSITGSTLRPRSVAQKAAIAAALTQRVWPVLNAGRCRPVIDTVFPLEQAAEAHALMESSQHVGKIILTCN